MNRLDLRTIIQTAGHGTDTASVAAQNSALQQAFYEVWTRRAWTWRRATAAPVAVVGNQALTTAAITDLAYPVKLRISESGIFLGDVEAIRPEVIEDYLAHDTGTGPPTYWSWSNQQVIVYPRPDKVYTVSMVYIKQPAKTLFDDDTDSIPFPEQYHPVLAWVALRILGFRQRDPTQYNIAKAEAEAFLTQMEREDSRAEQGQTSVVHWAGWDLVKSG